jgi:hypothetical protein
LEEEFEQRKLDHLREAKKRHVPDIFREEVADKRRPMANPKPVDDEPWLQDNSLANQEMDLTN